MKNEIAVELTLAGALAYRAKEIGKIGHKLYLTKAAYDITCPVSQRGYHRGEKLIRDEEAEKSIFHLSKAAAQVKALPPVYFEVVSVPKEPKTLEQCCKLLGFKTSKTHFIKGIIVSEPLPQIVL